MVKDVIGEQPDCAHLTDEQRGRLDDVGGLILVHDIDGHGQVFYRSPASTRYPLPKGLLDEAVIDRTSAWFDTYETSAGLVRMYSAPYRSHAGRLGLIRIMETLGDVEEPLAALRRILGLLAPVALLLFVLFPLANLALPKDSLLHISDYTVALTGK